MIDVDPARFEEMVAQALDGLPEELGKLMRNVAVLVEHGEGPPGLLGLYEGIPLTNRSTQYSGVLPDRITIYRRTICATCWSEWEVEEQVRKTVIHEVAHHFGIGDDRLRELGWLPSALLTSQPVAGPQARGDKACRHSCRVTAYSTSPCSAPSR